jgi:hypothetical protein
LTTGERLLLKLGKDGNKEVTIDDQRILSRVVNVTVICGTQRLCQARQPGTTTLTATSDPACRKLQPLCARPSGLVRSDVTVK